MKANGESAYSYYGKKPEMNGLMQRAMSGVSVPFLEVMLEDYRGFEGVKRLVDVGGSAGDCLKMILRKHSHVREGINFDLPEVVARAPTIPGEISAAYSLLCFSFPQKKKKKSNNCIHLLKNYPRKHILIIINTNHDIVVLAYEFKAGHERLDGR